MFTLLFKEYQAALFYSRNFVSLFAFLSRTYSVLDKHDVTWATLVAVVLVGLLSAAQGCRTLVEQNSRTAQLGFHVVLGRSATGGVQLFRGNAGSAAFVGAHIVDTRTAACGIQTSYPGYTITTQMGSHINYPGAAALRIQTLQLLK